MNLIFYISAAIAIFSTLMVVMKQNAIHALLYLVVSLFSIAVVFFTVGASFVGALEIIVYAGAIMVLFVFVVMLLNIGPGSSDLKNPGGLGIDVWIFPGILAAILLVEMIYILFSSFPRYLNNLHPVLPKQVGIGLFTTYQLGTELASILLLAGLVGAYHIGKRLDISKESVEKK